jgi:hypothetical protein
MPFWRNASSLSRLCGRFCSGRLLPALTLEGLFLSVAVTTLTSAQDTQHRPTPKEAAAHRANELTLAGLRPGRDKLGRAIQLFTPIDPKSVTNDSQTFWLDSRRKQCLTIEFDSTKKIQVIRAGVAATANCPTVSPTLWKTGLGLRVDDPVAKVIKLYGEPDSKSPSTKNGQPLELWCYQFDWAGPDVPQVMEILCTREKDGQPGRVIEITLAAPSL